MNDTKHKLYRVVAVNIKTGARRVIESGKTERNAEAIVMMAVMRRGVEEEYFDTEPEEASDE